MKKSFKGRTVVNEVCLEIQSGRAVGLLGPNGAGKSTTLKIITGFLLPDRGEVRVCGIDIRTQSLEAKKKIGYLPESNPLYEDMYVREYLRFLADLHHLRNKKKRIAQVIEQVGLTPESGKKNKQLSKGYKQRVGLAAALLHDPEVLILDEPTSHLDIGHQIALLNSLTELSKESNCAVVASLHDIGLIGRAFTHALLFTSTGGDEGSYISGAVNDVVNPANLEKALGHPVQRVIAADGRQVFIPA